MLTKDFQDAKLNISDGFDNCEENFQDKGLSILDGFDSYEEQDTGLSISDSLDSYEGFQLSLQQMEQHYSVSHFDQDQEIQRLSRPTPADYGQNVNTTSTQYGSHHHDPDVKILPGLSSSSMLPQALHRDDCGMKCLSPPTNYGYSYGQAVDAASVQHNLQVQDDAYVDVSKRHSIEEDIQGNSASRPFLQADLQGMHALASSTLQSQDHGSIDTSMTPPCQEDTQGVHWLAFSDSQVKYYDNVAADSSMMHPFQGDIRRVHELAYSDSAAQYYGHVAVDSSMTHQCQGDIQRVHKLAYSNSQAQYYGNVAVESYIMHPCQGDIQGVPELAYSDSQVQYYGNVAVDSSTTHPCKGDIQGVQPHAFQGDQENQAPYNNTVDRVEAPASLNAEANIHQSGVDHSDTVPDRSQGRSIAASNLQNGSILESKAKVKRSRHTQEDLLKLRNYYKDTSQKPNFSECYRLSYGTNLDFKQISDWFSNEREKAPKKESGDTQGIIGRERKQHSDSQITVLKAWVAKNEPKVPLPTKKEKKELAHKTGLSLEQVSGWFMNIRKKRKAALSNEL